MNDACFLFRPYLFLNRLKFIFDAPFSIYGEAIGLHPPSHLSNITVKAVGQSDECRIGYLGIKTRRVAFGVAIAGSGGVSGLIFLSRRAQSSWPLLQSFGAACSARLGEEKRGGGGGAPFKYRNIKLYSEV